MNVSGPQSQNGPLKARLPGAIQGRKTFPIRRVKDFFCSYAE